MAGMREVRSAYKILERSRKRSLLMPEEEEAQRKNGSYGERLCGSEVDAGFG